MATTLLVAPGAQADDLHYFKNYFVTGDYTVAGVGLYGKGVGGVATGKINMTTVPAGADIVAAFLYWQTVETSAATAPAAINGTFDGNAIVGDVVGNPAAPAPACWTPEGTTSASAYARTYRADVLRYLQINSALNIRTADYTHTVVLPDSGAGAVTAALPHTMGATLVVVYRMLPVLSAPYKAVVIYDGASTMTKSSAALAQTIGGFYQAAGSGAKMTQIMGNGQSNMNVNLTVNGSGPQGTNDNLFDGALGTRWDSPTFNINLPLNAATLSTQVNAENNQVCLSWSAVIMSTNVVDSDGDGLLDIWESQGLHLNPGTYGAAATANTGAVAQVPATFGTCTTYPSDPADPCENFPAMGAKNGIRDVFLQIDWMSGTDATTSYSHIHVPKLAALQMIANVFASHGLIAVHFDVGSHYQQTPALPYIVPAKYARGGNVIPETSVECPPTPVPADYTPPSAGCTFSSVSPDYSILGWKVGFNAIANGYPYLNLPAYFPHDRKDTFHYVLFGHALSVPSVINPNLPGSVSGVADTPGGDVLVTLGLWNTNTDSPSCVQDDMKGTLPAANLCTNETGTVLVQAGTLMHELGHNLGLYHGGAYHEPNCMSDYPSVMNYMYQTAGLTDTSGNEHIDYSFGLLNGLNENSLSETKSLGVVLYRTRYYAPPNAMQQAAGSAAQGFYCDGTPIPKNSPTEVRLETPGLGTPDWNNNGKVDGSSVAVDINYNGTTGSATNDSVQPTVPTSNPSKQWFVDHDDWLNLNLQQMGARLDVDGLSSDVSASDLGPTDLGQSSLGQSSLGQSSLGQSSLGDVAQNDAGQSSLGQSSLGDIDYDTATSTLTATSTSNPLVATVVASNSTPATAYNAITLAWGAPGIGQIVTYNIYRANLSAASPVAVLVHSLNGTPSVAPATTYTDVITDATLADSGANCPSTAANPQMCYNANYQYFITAVGANNVTSTPSNTVTGTVDHLFVTAYSGSVVYGNTLPNYGPTAAAIAGLPSGGITSSNFTCTNTTGSVPPRNAVSYAITCTGPLAVGTGSIYGVTYIPGVLTITQRPITVTANTNTKTYDGGASAGAAPTVSSTLNPAIVAGDTANFIETYSAGKNVGTGLTLAPSGSVSDGNSGANYAVTLVNNTTGVISARPITVTAVNPNKFYDGTTMANAPPLVTAAPAYTPPIVGTDMAAFSEAYSSKNVGDPALTVIPTGAVSDGNGGKDYAVTLVSVGGTIQPAPLTITAVTYTKAYDGTTSIPLTPTYSPNPLVGAAPVSSDTFTTLTEAYSSPNAGNNITISVTYVISDGNNGNNYAVTPMSTTGTINTVYTADTTLTDFTSPLIGYAQFMSAASSDLGLPYTPSVATIVTVGDRVVGSSSQPIIVQFQDSNQNPVQVAGIRVFPSIDHFGSAYDGYQYAISGSNDPNCGTNPTNATWTPLFDALSVSGSAEPFTLGTFSGTPPNIVNNLLTDGSTTGVGPGQPSDGYVGYEADFIFGQAYACYSFSPSTQAAQAGNADQELTAVGALPSPPPAPEPPTPPPAPKP